MYDKCRTRPAPSSGAMDESIVRSKRRRRQRYYNNACAPAVVGTYAKVRNYEYMTVCRAWSARNCHTRPGYVSLNVHRRER